MANVKISQLGDATTPLAGTETLEIVQSGVNKKVAVADVGADGNVVGPASNAASFVPQWDGTPDSKTLVEGFPITAVGKALIDDATTANQRATLGIDALTIGVAYESAQLPGDGAIINVPRAAVAFTIPANLVGSYCDAVTGPTAEAVVSVTKNGTEFATMTIAIGATSAVTLAGTETSFVAGDRLSFEFPTPQDASWAGVTLTVQGTRT